MLGKIGEKNLDPLVSEGRFLAIDWLISRLISHNSTTL